MIEPISGTFLGPYDTAIQVRTMPIVELCYLSYLASTGTSDRMKQHHGKKGISAQSRQLWGIFPQLVLVEDGKTVCTATAELQGCRG